MLRLVRYAMDKRARHLANTAKAHLKCARDVMRLRDDSSRSPQNALAREPDPCPSIVLGSSTGPTKNNATRDPRHALDGFIQANRTQRVQIRLRRSRDHACIASTARRASHAACVRISSGSNCPMWNDADRLRQRRAPRDFPGCCSGSIDAPFPYIRMPRSSYRNREEQNVACPFA